ncbi:flagellar motor switch protein FliG [Rhodophyticola sp. CCM32]|uniref:flagellar motor switch protein FliG n=1 Tax=Rhodophyticola sp. CCM32 TaxID=2916397 RepID=UPI00143DB14D|nr:FliG C-terminal domain-containing protein [Rhodophyticola sp. CCM32]
MAQGGEVLDHAGPAPSGGPGAVQRLTPGQKAAVIVRLLLSEDVPLALDRLTPVQQERLARYMATLSHVNRATLAGVVQEFTTALDNLALIFPEGLPDALTLLEPHLSAPAREGLLAETQAQTPADPWARLAELEDEDLVALITSESAEVCAILLSKLSVARAAEILAMLPEDRAELVAHAVSLTSTVSPDMVDRIGMTLTGQLGNKPKIAFNTSAVDRVGAILNAASGSIRDAILDGLDKRNAEFAEQVRRAIFTFEHIPKRLKPTDVPKVMRLVDPGKAIIACASGLAEYPIAVEFLLENMSKRMAEQLREDAETLGTPRLNEGEAAMAEIITAIRDLVESNEIMLIPQEEDEI